MDRCHQGRATHSGARTRLIGLLAATALLVGGLVGLPATGNADQLIATVSVPTPSGVAVDPANGRAYVGSEFDSHIQVIDPVSLTLLPAIDLPQGSGAASIAVDATRGIAYVTERRGGAGDEVFVIDLATQQVVDSIGGMHRPWGVTLDPELSLAYVADQFGEAVVVIDTDSRTVIDRIAMAAGSYPTFIAVDPDANRLFVTTQDSTGVAVIDRGTRQVIAHLPLPLSLNTVADPATHRLFVAAHAADYPVVAYDTQTLAELGRQEDITPPYSLAVDPVGSRLYVGRAHDVYIHSLSDLTLQTSVPLGGVAFSHLALDSDSRTLFVSDYLNARVHVVGSRFARVSPEAVEFRDVPPGTMVEQTVHVTAAGRLPVTVADFAVSGPDAEHFAITGSTCPDTAMQMGTTCEVNVSVSPASRTALSARLTAGGDDDAGVRPVTLSATWTPDDPSGIQPPAVASPPPQPTTPVVSPPARTRLTVRARSIRFLVPLGRRTTLVRGIVSNAPVRVRVGCDLHSSGLPMGLERKLCDLRVLQRAASATSPIGVTAAPICSAVHVHVSIRAKAAGSPARRWHRHWHASATPRVPCQVPGTG